MADHVVTTCAEVVPLIQAQAKLPAHRCLSIPTGLIQARYCRFTGSFGISRKVGRSSRRMSRRNGMCLRGWKGISDLLQAAKLLEPRSEIEMGHRRFWGQ